jgi:proteasome accessory factor A
VRTRERWNHGLATMTGIFTENGGQIYHEHLPWYEAGGLVEGATPECRSPAELLVYQKALDRLLDQALSSAAWELSRVAPGGKVALLKNCRDAEGNTYGAQESYEVDMASGLDLLLLRTGLVLLAPLLLLHVVIAWSVTVVGLLLAAGVALVWLVLIQSQPSWFWTWVKRMVTYLEIVILWPVIAPLFILIRLFAFRPYRRILPAFLASRVIFTGAGTVESDGRYTLAEKAPVIRRLLRTSITPWNRPVFDTGHIAKALISPVTLRISPFLQLFGQRQRLQLSYSDSNMAQVAEYLKVGTTALVIDMIEAGCLDDAPRLARPVHALRAIAADSTLQTRVAVRRGPAMTALELQRYFLHKARAYVRNASSTSLEANDIIALWSEVLEALEKDPSEMIGRVDWVSKRYLLETAAGDAHARIRKKIDLKYHELATGYFAELEDAGLTQSLVSEEEIERAIHSPPASTPAFRRGQLVKTLADSATKAHVSWSEVRIGGMFRGKVISLADFRKR